jgi:hypothetical protein
VGGLFMSLIHTAELCSSNPFDYLTEFQRRAGELATHPPCEMDAVELPGGTGSDRRRRGFRVECDESNMARKRTPDEQKREGFSARYGNRRNCFAPASMPASPPTINRPYRCRSARFGNTPPGETGRSPCR